MYLKHNICIEDNRTQEMPFRNWVKFRYSSLGQVH